MKNWLMVLVALCSLAVPGQVVFGDEHEEKIYLDEDYEDGQSWALGIGFGLVELGDNFVQGATVISDDTVEQYLMLSLRIPFGDRHAHSGSSSAGFRGYLEPEIGYWDGDVSSDLLVGLNIVGGMPFNAVEFWVGGGVGFHFLDSDLALPNGDDSSDALGINAHFGVDVSVSKKLSLFGTGRFDLVDDDRDELEGKAAVGLRFRF